MPTKLTQEIIDRRRIAYESTSDDVFVCGECGESKRGIEFYFEKERGSGRRTRRCKKCTLARLDGYEKSDEAKRRILQRKNKRRYYSPRTLKRQIINLAIKAGVITKPDTCESCGQRFDDSRKIHGHHPRGWDTPETIFDITWLCIKCHEKEHEGEGLLE